MNKTHRHLYDVKAVLRPGRRIMARAAFPLFLSCLALLPRVPGQTSEAGLEFVDMRDSSGVAFLHTGGSPEKKYIIDTVSGGVALLDHDNDGDLDLYFVNGSSLDILSGRASPVRNRLYRNDGNFRFTDVTDQAGVGDTGWGMGACAADFDNDGDVDLYVTNLGPNVLYRNNGDGRFSDVTAKAGVGDSRWSTGAAFADYDQDGDLDLYVANYVDVDFQKLPEPGQSKYCYYRGLPVMCGPRGLKPASHILYRNNGDGTFTDVSQPSRIAEAPPAYGLGVVWGDYDNDGDSDLYVANDSMPNFLFRNNGDGTLDEVALLAGVALSEDGKEQAGMGVDFGDYDGDGWLDLYKTNFSDDTNNLYRNLGDNFFEDVAHKTGHGETTWSYLGWGTSFFDFDNDGDLDLLAVNGHVYPQVDGKGVGTSYRQRPLLFENRGGTFVEVAAQRGAALNQPRSSRGAAFGDLDDDGDVDVVVNNMDDLPSLWRNEGGNRRGWIQFDLRGTRSNRSAVGARVTIWVGKRRQIAEVKAGSSYLSQSDPRLHLGLGEARRADRVEIRWPSGLVQTFTDLEGNALYEIREGDSRPRRAAR
ncbi:MAG: CRTAC1 family protein [Acidobacteria bacterium]|nr:CRTAC1 family protein [Acidobacteriota bacterium]